MFFNVYKVYYYSSAYTVIYVIYILYRACSKIS